MHDPQTVDHVIRASRPCLEETEFDFYVRSILHEVENRLRDVMARKLDTMPMQAVHGDLHPHNVLFNSDSKEVRAIIDFEHLKVADLISDVAFAMHRFARTCGIQTEMQHDAGVEIIDRAALFLGKYIAEKPLKKEEIEAIPYVLQRTALRNILRILEQHYVKNNSTWSFDLQKQVTMLREAGQFSF